MKKILVVCGAGLVTATLVCKDIESILSHRKIDAQVLTCKATQIEGLIETVDVIVTSLYFEKDPNKPMVILQSLFGEEYQSQLEDKLLTLLKN